MFLYFALLLVRPEPIRHRPECSPGGEGSGPGSARRPKNFPLLERASYLSAGPGTSSNARGRFPRGLVCYQCFAGASPHEQRQRIAARKPTLHVRPSPETIKRSRAHGPGPRKLPSVSWTSKSIHSCFADGRLGTLGRLPARDGHAAGRDLGRLVGPRVLLGRVL